MQNERRQFPKKFSLLDKISYLQRAVLMASITYYELNTNVMSDAQYDGISYQLLGLMRECPNPEDSQYWYVFEDFDANTGFDLRDRLTEKDRDYLTRLAVCALYATPGREPVAMQATVEETPSVPEFPAFIMDADGQMSLF